MYAQCLFCGGDPSEPDHWQHCDGRQGQVEARAPSVPWRETSVEAARRIEPHLARLEQLVANTIRASANGLTCDEVERLTALSHQTASARINGLYRRQVIVAIGDKRLTRTGRRALVWRDNHHAQHGPAHD